MPPESKLRIARCVCTNLTFAELLDTAVRECLDLAALRRRTGASDGCGLCTPYLRTALRTGQTEFHELMTDEPANTPARPAEPPPPERGGKLVMSWSGGKDSALALYRLQRDPRYEVVGLMTTVSREYQRISHHGVREELLHRQAEAIGLPVTVLYFPPTEDAPPTMESLEAHMAEILAGYREQGVTLVGHGDIFLEELRAYRDRKLATAGMRGVFPLWREDTTALLREFTELGFRAWMTCVEPVLGIEFAGAAVDRDLLGRLPDKVDPCGEFGEFHSFVYDGPIFSRPIAVTRGETVERDGRFYTDLLAT